MSLTDHINTLFFKLIFDALTGCALLGIIKNFMMFSIQRNFFFIQNKICNKISTILLNICLDNEKWRTAEGPKYLGHFNVTQENVLLNIHQHHILINAFEFCLNMQIHESLVSKDKYRAYS